LRCIYLFSTNDARWYYSVMNDSADIELITKRDPADRLARATIYARLDEGLEQLKRIGGIPSQVEAQGIWSEIWYTEAHNSTAIEGNTLNFKEVEILLREGRAAGNKDLADYLEVVGYAAAQDWAYGQALTPAWGGEAPITMAEVRHAHHMIMANVWEVRPHDQARPEESPGNFRRHDIATLPGGMRPPPWPEVDAAVHDWVQAVCVGPDPDKPITEVLADWFVRLECIHPFLDGNDRTGRILINLILLRLGLPPMIIFKRQRAVYLAAIQKADSGSLGPLGEFFARAILETLNKFLIPALAGPHRLAPIASLADRDVTARALRDAAIRGRLKAQHGRDGQWLSTRHAVEEYKKSRSPGLRTR
jgi:Fic family protein